MALGLRIYCSTQGQRNRKINFKQYNMVSKKFDQIFLIFEGYEKLRRNRKFTNNRLGHMLYKQESPVQNYWNPLKTQAF